MSDLGIARNEGETWREACARYGRAWGLEDEVLYEFDEDVAAGTPEDEAAWGACLEWDVLDLVRDGASVAITKTTTRTSDGEPW